jgi:tetratricopeptide (TPR) repeat protein
VSDAAGIELSFANGQAALTVAPRALAAVARLDHMEVMVPARGHADDGALTPERARLRRGRLRTAVITLDEAGLRAAFDAATLAAAGVTELGLSLADGYVLLRARAASHGREADFTARALVAPAAGRRLRLTVDDVRIYGYLPVPAPLLGGALVGATRLLGSDGHASRHWSVEVDALDLAIYETFAAAGFRLPDLSKVRLLGATIATTGVLLSWSAETKSFGEVSEITATAAPRPIAEAEDLLVAGEIEASLAAYRKAARGTEASGEAARRVLEILVARPETFDAAAEQAARLAPTGGGSLVYAPAIALARAAIALERGDAEGAARAYADVAASAARAGELVDAHLARLAAGRAWLVAGRAEEARPLLETAVGEHPDDARAAELFAACKTDVAARATVPAEPGPEAEEDTGVGLAPSSGVGASPLLSPVAPDTAELLRAALALADEAEAAQRSPEAAAALRRALDLAPPGDPARAEIARRLAAVCEKQGDDDGALMALRELLTSSPPSAAVAPAWRRIVELHARRGDPQAAARALIASADDARTGSTDEERGAALTAAAEILRKRLGLPGDAVMLLERAIALAPRATETLDALQTIAVEGGDWERLADVLERKVDVDAGARGPIAQKDLLVQLAEVYDRQLQRADRARDTHERALRLDAAFRPSLLWLARDAWVRGDGAAATALYGKLAEGEAAAKAPADEIAETHIRVGLLARRAGDDGAAELEAARALAAVSDHAGALDLLTELYEAQARHVELADVLGRRAATGGLGAAARADLTRKRAVALERAGRLGEAAAAWLPLVEGDAAALPALRRLADAARAANDAPTLLAVLEPLGEALAATGDAAGAEQVLGARMQLVTDAATLGALATERARLLLLLPEGAEAARLALGAVALEALPEEGLTLRADLAERHDDLADALPALDELLARARAGGQGLAVRELEVRLTDLRGRLAALAPASVEELERRLAADPTDVHAAEELADVYAALADPRARAEALGDLLRRALGMPADRRKAIYAALGESAEATGDLERAEQAYWRAATIEAEPALRANYLVSHARVLLARGEVQTAMTELEEAIQRVPHHAGALALLADLTFRTQDWTRARMLYAELEAAPDAAQAIARDLLVHRRAVLADAQGDIADAEAFYRELAILNPRHAEARRALAEIAIHRGDFGAAALRLEEVLRLLPLDAVEPLVEVRQRTGAVYVHLGDWGSARYYLELVLAQDPTRAPSLEYLVEVYERLGLYKEAGQACARLSRLVFEPDRRAAILYKQAEILREHLGDEDGAFDAYLKSSDLDPRFVPTMVRLVGYFWRQGDDTSLSEVAADLAAAGFEPGDDLELAVRLVLGTAFSRRGGAATKWSLGGRFDAVVAAHAFAEVAATRPDPAAALDKAMAALLDGAPTSAGAAAATVLAGIVGADPANVGALWALARLADRLGDSGIARAAHALLAFAAPNDVAVTARLAALGVGPPSPPAATAVGGEADHPEGPAPVRRALAALAVPLLGVAGPAPAPARGAGTLAVARADALARLAERLGAPAVAASVEESPTPRVTLAPADVPPLPLLVTSAAAALSDAAWTFLAARALEEARSGLLALRGLDARARTEILAGAQAGLLGATPDRERPREAARRVAAASATLPTGDARTRLAADLAAALSAPVDWEAVERAAAHTANRVALLCCGSPADALALLAREDAAFAKAGPNADAAARRAFLATPAVRELARFMFSPAYAVALAGDA